LSDETAKSSLPLELGLAVARKRFTEENLKKDDEAWMYCISRTEASLRKITYYQDKPRDRWEKRVWFRKVKPGIGWLFSHQNP